MSLRSEAAGTADGRSGVRTRYYGGTAASTYPGAGGDGHGAPAIGQTRSVTESPALLGRHVHLLPLEHAHAGALLAAATEDRSTFGFAPVPWDEATMATYVERALAARAAGDQLPFATWSVDAGRIVGSTRFYGLTPWDWSLTRTVPADGDGDGAAPPIGQRTARPDRAEVGYTWLAPSAQRTPVNTEAKLMMLTHAFEVWRVHAVGIQTDVRNARSRRAIERLGCRLDGILRAERPAADGTIRDSARFSMLAAEWPAAKARLSRRLAAP